MMLALPSALPHCPSKAAWTRHGERYGYEEVSGFRVLALWRGRHGPMLGPRYNYTKVLTSVVACYYCYALLFVSDLWYTRFDAHLCDILAPVPTCGLSRKFRAVAHKVPRMPNKAWSLGFRLKSLSVWGLKGLASGFRVSVSLQNPLN